MSIRRARLPSARREIASRTCDKDTVKAGDAIDHASSSDIILTLVPHDLPKAQWSRSSKEIKSAAKPELREQLRQAWTLVTHRFHRDAPPPPTDPGKRRDLLAWLQRHPLWTHPITIHVPPDLNEREPDVDGYFETRADGSIHLRERTPDWVAKTLDDGGGSYHERIEPEFVYVDPTCEYIVGHGAWYDDQRNADFRVWLEAGGWGDSSLDPNLLEPPEGWDNYNRWHRIHDIKLDCGAATLEEALIQLALRLQFFYGDTRDHLPERVAECGYHEASCDLVNDCEDAGDGFCRKCGRLIERYSSQFTSDLRETGDA